MQEFYRILAIVDWSKSRQPIQGGLVESLETLTDSGDWTVSAVLKHYSEALNLLLFLTFNVSCPPLHRPFGFPH